MGSETRLFASIRSGIPLGGVQQRGKGKDSGDAESRVGLGVKLRHFVLNANFVAAQTGVHSGLGNDRVLWGP